MRTLVFIPILIILSLTCACNNTGCTDNRSSIPLAEFYSSSTGQRISVDSIAIGGVDAPGDSLLVEPRRGIQSVYLPFRSQYNNASFFISYRWSGMEKRNNDTIVFYYEPLPYFASEECGAMYRYRITEMASTVHLLDSVVILDSLITNIERPSIRIYFPTNSDQEQ